MTDKEKARKRLQVTSEKYRKNWERIFFKNGSQVWFDQTDTLTGKDLEVAMKHRLLGIWPSILTPDQRNDADQ